MAILQSGGLSVRSVGVILQQQKCCLCHTVGGAWSILYNLEYSFKWYRCCNCVVFLMWTNPMKRPKLSLCLSVLIISDCCTLSVALSLKPIGSKWRQKPLKMGHKTTLIFFLRASFLKKQLYSVVYSKSYLNSNKQCSCWGLFSAVD